MDKLQKMGIELEPITDDEIICEGIKKKLASADSVEKVWRGALYIFVLAIFIGFIVQTFIWKDNTDWYYTKPGQFYAILTTISFLIFGFGYLVDRIKLNSGWQCPKCKQKLPYYTRSGIGGKRIGQKEVLVVCDDMGLKLGQRKGDIRILPDRCPRCREEFLKED